MPGRPAETGGSPIPTCELSSEQNPAAFVTDGGDGYALATRPEERSAPGADPDRLSLFVQEVRRT